MALDMSIIRGPKGIDFGQLYAVRDAVVYGMDWYLGDDKEQRHEQYLKFKEKALCMSREKVLSDAKVDEKTKEYLSNMDRNMFAIYLSWVIGSIADFTDKNNTHMEFDWELLPGITVIDSCSWNLKDVFQRFSIQNDYPDKEVIVELDLNKIAETNRKWQSKGVKMKLAKWIGFFFPNVGYRIAKDCMRELDLNDYWIDINDLLYYRESIETVAKFMQPDTDRLWLVSSY
jgi:hypothetical protein